MKWSLFSKAPKAAAIDEFRSIQRPLPRAALLWLLASGLLALLPHSSHLPAVFWVMALVTSVWRWLMHKGRVSYPGVKAKMLAVILVVAGVAAVFSGQYSLESAVGFFVAMAALKILEMRTQRDGYIVIFLCFFLLATGFLFEQELIWGLLGLLATWVMISTLVALQLTQSEPRSAMVTGRYAGLVLAVSLPMMLVLYLLFPRFGPLWSIKLQSETARTGLSDSMSPGDISSLAQSDELAFRVTFDDGQQPPRNELYWRALVLDMYDGRTWRFSKRNREVRWYPDGNQGQDLREATRYEIIQEETGEHWLYTLRYGLAMERGTGMTSTGLLVNRRPVFQRKRYRGLGRSAAAVDHRLSAEEARINLQLPQQGNPQLRQWVSDHYQSGGDANSLVTSLLTLFADEFTYTLKPPALGDNDIDAFLFDSQRGFCAHFSGAFVYAMRLAGIPARVVTGYQGGEWNASEGYLTVRQYDAHAWAEVWSESNGWVRIDPTAAVAPERIEFGLEQAMAEEGSFMESSLVTPGQLKGISWLYSLRMEMESLNYLWHRWVLSYDDQRQKSMLQSWFSRSDYLQLVAVAIGAVVALFLLVGGLVIWRGRSVGASVERRAWNQLLASCWQYELEVSATDSPLAVLKRLAFEFPVLAPQLDALRKEFEQVLYAPQASASGSNQTDSAHKALAKHIRRVRKQLIPLLKDSVQERALIRDTQSPNG